MYQVFTGGEGVTNKENTNELYHDELDSDIQAWATVDKKVSS